MWETYRSAFGSLSQISPLTRKRYWYSLPASRLTSATHVPFSSWIIRVALGRHWLNSPTTQAVRAFTLSVSTKVTRQTAPSVEYCFCSITRSFAGNTIPIESSHSSIAENPGPGVVLDRHALRDQCPAAG